MLNSRNKNSVRRKVVRGLVKKSGQYNFRHIHVTSLQIIYEISRSNSLHFLVFIIDPKFFGTKIHVKQFFLFSQSIINSE